MDSTGWRSCRACWWPRRWRCSPTAPATCKIAAYLGIPYIAGVGEIAVFCTAIAGAGLGFLWFNAYPAQVFMGDVGALALGAALGIVAVLVRQELILAVMGGVFVAETVSVALQVGYFKWSGGKRIFRMAPLQSPLRAQGLARAAHHRALLDRHADPGAGRSGDAEGALMSPYQGQRWLVIGLGKSGVSACRHLLAAGAQVIATDSRDNPPGLAEVQALRVPVHIGRFLAPEPYSDYQGVVLSPGVSPRPGIRRRPGCGWCRGSSATSSCSRAR